MTTWQIIRDITASGDPIDVSAGIIASTRSEDSKSFNQTVKITLIDVEGLDEALVLGLGALLMFDDAGKEIFRGIQFRKQKKKNNGTKVFTLTFFEASYYLMKSEDDRIIRRGTGAATAVDTLLQEQGFVLLNSELPDTKLPQLVFRGKRYGDMLFEILRHVRLINDKRYRIRYAEDAINILEWGTNNEKFVLDRATDVDLVESIENIVTEVKAYASVEKNDDAPTAAKVIAEASSDFKASHSIRKVFYMKEEEQSDAKKKAEKIIAEQGEPQIKFSVNFVDIPSLRVGDAVKMLIGGFDTDMHIDVISHDDKEQTMTIEVVEP